MSSLTSAAKTSAKWHNESCTYVVSSSCGAPVVTIDSTSTADGQFKVYVTEYTQDALTEGTITLQKANPAAVATGTALWYPGDKALTSYPTATTNTPNTEYGGI